METDKEICICAALIMPDGYIVRGHRHHDCWRTARDIPRYIDVWRKKDMEGFVTSKNRFVTRGEALRLQRDANIESVAPGGYRGDQLYSEDLYL